MSSDNGNGKSRFELRKLMLVVVVDERSGDGDPIRFDIELGPFFAPNAAKLASMLYEDLPHLLEELNERGTLAASE